MLLTEVLLSFHFNMVSLNGELRTGKLLPYTKWDASSHWVTKVPSPVPTAAGLGAMTGIESC
jgi:hypothetical protein